VPLFVGVGFASCETPTNKEHEMTQVDKDNRGSAKGSAIYRANGKDRANQPDHIEIAILKFEKARLLYRLEKAIEEFQS
jgi:hypothetical protein